MPIVGVYLHTADVTPYISQIPLDINSAMARFQLQFCNELKALFVAYPEDPTSSTPDTSRNPAALLRRATLASVVVAGVLISVKAVAWWFTGSLSLLASLVDSLFDIVSSIVNFLAVRYALQPADDEHRFGHGKAEDIAALGQSVFIAASGLFILAEATRRLHEPVQMQHNALGISVILFSIFATFCLVLYQRHVVKMTNSSVIKADSLHFITDIFTNSGTLVALLMVTFFDFGWADPVIAMCIAVYVLSSAWKIGYSAFHHLMDREFPDDERSKAEAIILSHPDVKSLVDLRTRRSGAQRFIQFNIALDDTISLRRAHSICSELELQLTGLFAPVEILIHPEPQSLSGHNTNNSV